MAFRIAQISDTHLSATKSYFVENFRRVTEAVGAAGCDLLLNTGDISLDGAESAADLHEARRLHDGTGLPVRFVPGNHDLGDSQELGSQAHRPIDPARRARYIRRFGPDWWSIDVPGWRLIAVNAQLVGANLPAAAEQDAFVAAAASAADGRALALFIHKPLFDATPDEATFGGRFLNPTPRRRLLAALGRARPRLVASGHVHQHRDVEIDGVRHVWGPSAAFVIPDEWQPRYGRKEVGYVEHLLHEDGSIDSRFVAPPGVATLSLADFPDAYDDLPGRLSPKP